MSFAYLLTKGIAEVTPSRIERAEDILQKEEDLRKEIDTPEKIFFKNIVVKGTHILSREELEDIIAPYLKHWVELSALKEMQENLIKAYKDKDCILQLESIKFETENEGLLIVNIEEPNASSLAKSEIKF